MADLTRDFLQAVGIAWLCFGMGVVLFKLACKDRQMVFLSRALLFLSPAVLTCFGVHAVRENQQLVQMVRLQKSEAVGHGVTQLVRADVVETRNGCRIERGQFSDGRRLTRLSDIHGRNRTEVRRTGQTDGGYLRFDGRTVEVSGTSIGSRISWH
jgi:hypothetical protein